MRHPLIVRLTTLAAALCTSCGDSGLSSETEDVAPDETGAQPDDAPTDEGPTIPSPPTPGALGDCVFSVDYELSSAIGTVGIVRWSTDLTVDGASIVFGLKETGFSMSAPVDLSEPGYRTLLLGMKGDRDYTFQIMVAGAGEHCRSQVYSLTTDPIPTAVSKVSREFATTGATARGFIVTSAGIGNFFAGGSAAPEKPMFIFDMDGDIVWWADAPAGTTRARMDWEGRNMWMSALNYPPGNGEMRRVSMDGLEVEADVEGLENNHHDFTVAPGGIVTSISYHGGCDAIIERAPSGRMTTVVESVAELYEPGNGLLGTEECHGNAITYQPEADTYVISDRNPSLFARFTRDGELLWQFGGGDPKGMHFAEDWNVNHGHHLLENGNLLFFNNESGNPSSVKEYALDEEAERASLVWEYAGDTGSVTLGDVQRLPNGNTLITYSNVGTLLEVDPGKNVVQRFTTETVGYAMYRQTLYGPPPR